jgi:hypothetical protein
VKRDEDDADFGKLTYKEKKKKKQEKAKRVANKGALPCLALPCRGGTVDMAESRAELGLT